MATQEAPEFTSLHRCSKYAVTHVEIHFERNTETN